ncbi:hypothetical protein GALL_493870 [mine drainage metagenome]|uniref:Uncharacterized protein n=1 Tax=mine drainage metagenome TaxID=410659 RepID=A0A1J5PBH7_9ZZZZ
MELFNNKLVQAKGGNGRKKVNVNCSARQNPVKLPAQVSRQNNADNHFYAQTAHTANKQHARIFKILFKCLLVKTWDVRKTHICANVLFLVDLVDRLIW